MKTLKITLIIALLFFIKNTYSQCTADFTYTIDCLDVTFTDVSDPGGSTITNWDWTFVGGSPSTSTQQNPTATFPVGTHNVTLQIVTAASCTDNITIPITIHPQPTASITGWSVDLSSCPNTIDFTGIVNNETTYEWDFGDGSPNTTSLTPSHTYLYNPPTGSPVTYDVILTAFADIGGFYCEEESTPVTVTIYPDLVPDFTMDYTFEQCSYDSIHFTNITQGGTANNTYLWDFGDGSFSSEENPVHKFNAYGDATETYDVTLTVTNPNNSCVSSVMYQVTVIERPDATLFENNYTDFNNCGYASPSDPNFTIDVSYAPSVATTNTWYEISWGDGTGNYLSANPPINLIHTYTALGVYDLTFTITVNSGCHDTKVFTVLNIANPGIGLGSPPNTTGCAPFDVTFPIMGFEENDASTIYTLCLGDGNCVVFNHPPPSTYTHTYTTSSCEPPGVGGQFQVSIVAENDCQSNWFTYDGIIVYTSPNPQFQPDNLNGCVNSEIFFNNTTLPSGGLNCSNQVYMQWDFGDGTVEGPGWYNHPYPPATHMFTSAGVYTVTLKMWSNCLGGDPPPNNDWVTYEVDIAIGNLSVYAGPDQIIDYGVSATLNGSVAVGTPPYTYHWEPDALICSGQGTLTPTTCNIYVSTLFTLIVTGENGCVDTDDIMIFLNTDTLLVDAWAGPDQICSGGLTELYAIPSGGSGNYSFLWSPASGLNDPTSGNTIATPIETTTYTITVDDGFYTAQDSVTITVHPLPWVYAGADTAICANTQYQINDSDADFASAYMWSTYPPGAGVFTDAFTLHPVFAPNNSFAGSTIALILCGTGNGICQYETVCDTMYLYIEPIPEVYASNDASTCDLLSYQILDAAVAFASSFEWAVTSGFGTLDLNNIIDPIYTPAQEDAGTTVILTLCANGTGACSSETVCDIMELYIEPFPTVFAGADASICVSSIYQIPDATIEFYSSFIWEVTVGNGVIDNPNILTPTYIPALSDAGTIVILTLCANGSGACSSETVCDEIEIYIDAIPEVYAGADAYICVSSPYQVPDATVDFASSFEWVVTSGFGILDFDNIINPIYTPAQEDAGTTVILTLCANGTGACSSETICDTINIDIIQIPEADFNYENTCVYQSTNFYDLSVPGIGNIVEWQWDFGDGTSSSLQNPSYIYSGSGTYEVGLAVTNSSGCQDVFSQSIVINELPEVSLEPFELVCLNWPSFELTGGMPEGGIYTGNGVTDNWFYPGTAGLGSHIITYTHADANGCENYAEEGVWVDACTGVTNNPMGNGISIYPNPNNGSFTIELNSEKDDIINIKIINILGETVYKKRDIPIYKGCREDINLQDQPDGLYYVLISGKYTSTIKKVIIQ